MTILADIRLALRGLRRKPGELVMLWQDATGMGSNTGARMHSYPIYQDFRRKAEPLAEVLCRRLVAASIRVDGSTELSRSLFALDFDDHREEQLAWLHDGLVSYA